jgi:hypothetical protein
MKIEKKLTQKSEEKTGFSEKEFIDYLEERFRKLKLDEQKFRDEVLAQKRALGKNSQFTKIAR